MATLAQSEAHRSTLARLSTLAVRDVSAVTSSSLRGSDARAITTSLLDSLPPVAELWRDVAATAASDFYADLRGARFPQYRPVLASRDITEQLRGIIRWGVTPIWSDEPDPQRALRRIEGGLQRVIVDADRETIVENIRRDPAEARWARHASANACAFCAMLATRGPDYRSEDTASASHDNCRCIAVPVWDDFEEAPYVARWREAYEQAASGGKTPKEIVAGMRERLGTN